MVVTPDAAPSTAQYHDRMQVLEETIPHDQRALTHPKRRAAQSIA
jgi:hypothetical protein